MDAAIRTGHTPTPTRFVLPSCLENWLEQPVPYEREAGLIVGLDGAALEYGDLCTLCIVRQGRT